MNNSSRLRIAFMRRAFGEFGEVRRAQRHRANFETFWPVRRISLFYSILYSSAKSMSLP